MPETPPNASFFHASPKRGMPKWLFVTLIASSFAIIMWVIGIGVIVSNSKTKSSTTPTPEFGVVSPTPLPNTNLGPTPVTISPSPVPLGWKKYTHSLYTISYPSDWVLRQFGDANTVQLYNPTTVKSTTDATLIGASLASQFILIHITPSSQTPTQYVDSIAMACCTGPSPTPGVANLFQRQSVTLHDEVGVAYTIPSTNFKNWSIVFSVNSNLIELSSSIESITGTKTENTMLNTLILNPT